MSQSDWTKYRMTREQLLTYMQLFTDNNLITIIDGPGSTHYGTGVVTIPLADPMATTTATHEGLHIKYPGVKAFPMLKSDAERTIFNVLDDGRIERLEARTQPGTRWQFQQDVDTLMPLVLKEDWITQALKCMYLMVGGYAFEQKGLKPKTRKLLTKFEPFVNGIRKSAQAEQIVPYIKPILALFDEELPKTKPAPQNATQEQSSFGEQGDFESEGDEDEEGEPGKGQGGASMDTTPDDEKPKRPGDKGKKNAFEDNEEEEDTEGDGSDDQGDGEPSECDECGGTGGDHADTCPYDGEGGYGGQTSDEPSDEEGGTASGGKRKGTTYNADDAAVADELAAKTGTKSKPSKGGSEDVEGNDRVTGGPSVNKLMTGASRIQQKLRKLEREQTAKRAENADESEFVTMTGGSAYGEAAQTADTTKGDSTQLPSEMKPLADVEGLLSKYNAYRPPVINIDWTGLLADGKGKSVGYRAARVNVEDARKPSNYYRNLPDIMDSVIARYGPTVNYLARQLSVLMQSADHKSARDYERAGQVDSRRLYHLGMADFRVFRQPPNASDSRPVVILTVDMSGSMEGSTLKWVLGSNQIDSYMPQAAASRAWHAICATLVVAGSLSKLGVPFEIHGFSGASIYIIKTFNGRLDRQALHALSNIALLGGGNTPAAEALAVAWARVKSRPEPRKIVIQVTDGAVPDVTGRISKAIEQGGGTSIGIGINTSGAIGRFFTHYIDVTNSVELPNKFARLLKKLLPAMQRTGR